MSEFKITVEVRGEGGRREHIDLYDEDIESLAVEKAKALGVEPIAGRLLARFDTWIRKMEILG